MYDNLWGQQQEVMDVSGSLRKIARELLEYDQWDPDLPLKLEAASWLISYIVDCLEVELQHAANRGREQAKKQLAPGPNGVKDYKIISGEDI